MTQEEIDQMRENIESLVGEYCDGTLRATGFDLVFSLEKAHFVEMSPQELADRLLLLFCGKEWK